MNVIFKQTPVVGKTTATFRNSISVAGFSRNLYIGGNNRLGFINENCIILKEPVAKEPVY